MELVNILPAFIITTAAILNQANADTGQQTSGTSKTYTRAEEFYSIPNLKILRQDGVTTTFPEELDDGRPVILNFIFTSCAAICPVSSRVLS
ncbi:MAG: hypothetical protein ACXV8J_06535, partial [Methylobacter sp.]